MCLSKRSPSIHIEVTMGKETCYYIFCNFVQNRLKRYDTANRFRKSAYFFRRRSMLFKNDDSQIYQYVLQMINLPSIHQHIF